MDGDGKWRTMHYGDGRFIVWRVIDGRTQYQLTECGELIELDYLAARAKARELNTASVA